MIRDFVCFVSCLFSLVICTDRHTSITHSLRPLVVMEAMEVATVMASALHSAALAGELMAETQIKELAMEETVGTPMAMDRMATM